MKPCGHDPRLRVKGCLECMVERGELPGWTAPTRIVRIRPNRWVVLIAALIAFLSLVMDVLTVVDRGVGLAAHTTAPRASTVPTSLGSPPRTNVISARPVLPASPPVPGQGYQICDANASYLTSPWTYNALGSGTATYTVAQYEALTGYGTTLPPLPSYIAAEPSTTEAAEIFAPGSTTNLGSFNVPLQPLVFYFEGGSYGILQIQSVAGSEYIGGSATGFPSPQFNDAGGQHGITGAQDTYGGAALATLASTAGALATTVTLNAANAPIVPWESITIGGQTAVVLSVSGPQSGYTLTLQKGLYTSEASGASVNYAIMAASVTVEYLNITNDVASTGGTINSGANWTIEHNDIHDGSSSSNQDAGTAIYDDGGSPWATQGGTIEYNCLKSMGHSALHEFGNNSPFDYNEVENDPLYNGSGGDSGDKWWHTENDTIVANAFVNDGPGGQPSAVWFDNGNTGFLVQGNYFLFGYGPTVDVETGFNGDITGNLFVNGGWGLTNSGTTVSLGAVELNESGGWPIPGSNYNNEMLVTNNTFIDDWTNISVFGSGSRSCLNSGEQSGTAPWNDAGYCAGGYPNGDGDFSHYNYPANPTPGPLGTLAVAATSGATTVLVSGSSVNAVPAVNDYVGFAGQPANTTTSSTAAVSSFTGSQTLPIASTTGFSSTGGQVVTATTTANSQGYGAGAVFAYTGTGSGVITGVTLVQGSGNLVNGGFVQAVEPYKVTAVTSFGSAWQLTISPGLTANQASGATLYNDGTCDLNVTPAATPTSPVAPDGLSYYDGCIWQPRNISVTGNTFTFNPATIAGTTSPWGTQNTACVSGSATLSCGTNAMQFQTANATLNNSTYGTFILTNAFVSNPGFMTPYTSSWNGVPASNGGEATWNNVWSGNTYNGPIFFYMYDKIGGGTCSAPGPFSCFATVAQWSSQWGQG